jgi:hypothetical protein
MTTLALLLAAFASAGAPQPITERERQLFASTAGLYLKRESWTEPLAYLHGHFLMVPLHTAVRTGDAQWLGEFEAHFERLAASQKSSWCKNPLSRAQYLYLATRYLALVAETKRQSPVAARLERLLTAEVVHQWTADEAIMWERAPFAGVKARVDYKLGLLAPKKSYFRAFTDEEFFHFAEAADLLVYRKYAGLSGPEDSTLREMVSYGARIVRTEGERTSGGGWLFQVGAWRDHPDNDYSGNRSITPGMAKNKREDVTMDSSHFHRFALFLTSLSAASERGDKEAFESARKGLAKQLTGVVLRPPTASFPGWRLTNYMNGWNGVYRFSSNAAVGEGKGYGPFELSGTLLLGWWSFLGDRQIQAVYADAAERFPLDETVLKTYLGPTYAPPPRKAKSWYENGLAELLASLASKQPVSGE